MRRNRLRFEVDGAVGMSYILVMNVQTIIQKAGGVGKLAALLGVSHPTVSDWKRTGFIPGGRIVQISRKLDVRVEDLSMLIKPADVQPQSSEGSV